MTWHSEVIRDVTRFYALELDYRTLLAESAAANTFLTWEWVTTWVEVFGHTCSPLVIAVRDGAGKLVGVGLFKVAFRSRCGIRVRQVEFIGTGEAVSPDGLDILTSRGSEAEIGGRLVAALMTTCEDWDVLALTDLAKGSLTLTSLQSLARKAGLPNRSIPDRVCPYIALPDSWQACQTRLSKSFSRHMRRGKRQLFEDQGVRFELLTHPSPEEVADGMRDVARLHQDRMEHTDRGGNFRKTDYYAFHLSLAQRLATRGELMVAFLRHRERRIAARYGFVYGRTYFAYQSGFDRDYERYSPSNVLLMCLIRHLIESRFEELNFLRGAQAHKYEWTDLERQTMRFTAWRGFRGRLLYAAERLRETAKTARDSWRNQVIQVPETAAL